MNDIPVLDLVCPPRTEMLRLIRRIILAASREVGFTPETANQIVLSVDEACTNAIQHATGSSRVQLKIYIGSDRLEIQVIDGGLKVPIKQIQGVRDLDEYIAQDEPRGLGSFIIDRFMDQVTYDSTANEGTVLSMIKYLQPAANG